MEFSASGDAKAKARIGVQLAELDIRESDFPSAIKYLDNAFSYFEKAVDKNGRHWFLLWDYKV